MEDQVMLEEMTNNEVIEVAEDFVEVGHGNGLKVFGGVLALAGLGYGAYRLIKRLRAKKEAAKKQADDKCIDVDFRPSDYTEDDED